MEELMSLGANDLVLLLERYWEFIFAMERKQLDS